MVAYILIMQNKSPNASDPWGEPLEATEDTLNVAIARLGLRMGLVQPPIEPNPYNLLPFNSFTYRSWMITGKNAEECRHILNKLLCAAPKPTEMDILAIAKLPVTCDEWEREREKLERIPDEERLETWREVAQRQRQEGPFDLGEVCRANLYPLVSNVLAGRLGGPDDGAKPPPKKADKKGTKKC